MNAEQKKRAVELIADFEFLNKENEIVYHAHKMAWLLQELIDAPDQGLAQRIGDFAHKYRMLASAPERDPELVRDAERYRWLRTYNTAKHPSVTEAFFLGDENLDAEIDAAIAAEKAPHDHRHTTTARAGNESVIGGVEMTALHALRLAAAEQPDGDLKRLLTWAERKIQRRLKAVRCNDGLCVKTVTTETE